MKGIGAEYKADYWEYVQMQEIETGVRCVLAELFFFTSNLLLTYQIYYLHINIMSLH